MRSVCTSLFLTHKVNIECLFAENGMRLGATSILIYRQRAMNEKYVAFETCVQNVENFISGSGIIEWKSIDCVSLKWSNAAVLFIFFSLFVSWLKVKTTEWKPASTMEINQKIERFFYISN